MSSISSVDVKLGKKLGAGKFCAVYRGQCKGDDVAVKACHAEGGEEGAATLRAEGELMSGLAHRNVVRFRGLVAGPPLMILLEYCVLSVLQLVQEEAAKLTGGQLASMVWEVASGLQFLAEKDIVHRDLAARNVLISTAGVCKITDFGLSGTVQKLSAENISTMKLPARWMPPEVLRKPPQYSLKVDVWSLGVLIYEMHTKGSRIYPELSHKDLVARYRSGDMPEAPGEMAQGMRRIMKMCWMVSPTHRPAIEMILREVIKLVDICRPSAHPPVPDLETKGKKTVEKYANEMKSSRTIKSSTATTDGL